MSYLAVDDVDKRCQGEEGRRDDSCASLRRAGIGRIAILKEPAALRRLDDARADVAVGLSDRPALTWLRAHAHPPAGERHGTSGRSSLEIIRRRSFRQGGAFKLASGRMSTIYFNLKPTMLDPEGARLIGAALAERSAGARRRLCRRARDGRGAARRGRRRDERGRRPAGRARSSCARRRRSTARRA